MDTRGWLLLCALVPACSSKGGAALSPSDAAKVCVIAEACFPQEWASGFFGGTLASCATGNALLSLSPGSLTGSPILTTGLEAPLSDIYHCIAAAGGNCAKAGACFGRDGPSGSCSPPASLETGSCNGSVLSGCSSDGVAFDVDCASYGETCHKDSIFFGTAAVCDMGSCPARTQCIGSKAQACVGAGLWLGDCARLGLSCVEPPDGGGAECWGPGSCDGGSSSCDGTVVVGCNGGVPSRMDCAQSSTLQRCQSGSCIETGNQCTVANDFSTCDGTQVKFCQDGTYREVDCAALGFHGCQAGACATASTSNGGGCAAFGAGCQSGGCCSGLTCDPNSRACRVSYGLSCSGATDLCAAPYSCLPSGVCGSSSTCDAYGLGCAAGACCSGLSCDSTANACYVANGYPCAGQSCAAPYSCLSSGLCGTPPACLPQNSPCTTGGQACCTGYSCTKSTGRYYCL